MHEVQAVQYINGRIATSNHGGTESDNPLSCYVPHDSYSDRNATVATVVIA